VSKVSDSSETTDILFGLMKIKLFSNILLLPRGVKNVLYLAYDNQRTRRLDYEAKSFYRLLHRSVLGLALTAIFFGNIVFHPSR